MREERSMTEGLKPVEDLIVIEETMNGRPVRIIKDDGCNTNVSL